MSLPSEDKTYRSKTEMEEDIVVLLGGRVAEALMIGDISTGASNDIQRATKTAHAMVTKYGMTENLGPVTYGSDSDEVFIGRDMGHVKNYSEKTAAEIDDEVRNIINKGYKNTNEILNAHVDKLNKVAEFLFKNEKMSGEEFIQIMQDESNEDENSTDENSKED